MLVGYKCIVDLIILGYIEDLNGLYFYVCLDNFEIKLYVENMY